MGAHRNSLKASPNKNPTTLQDFLDLDSRKNNGGNLRNHDNIVKLSSFESENDELISIISDCSSIYSFTDPQESPSQQDLKRLKLIRLSSIIKTSKNVLPDEIMSPLFSMLSANLFRPLSPICKTSIICPLADDYEDLITSFPSAAWPHLQIVYDILLRVVINTDAKQLQDYVNHSFLLKLLSLFQSEDSRERGSVKNVYHRLYSKFTFHRSFMRKAMNDVFLHFVFGTDQKHCGIGDLLEIWGSIINGFTVPLKEEHKLFLMRILLPMHKPKCMQVYHRQLTYCVTQFVKKEPMLGGIAVRGILRYWPITNCQKEVLFIGELEELVENIDPELYRKLALPLFTQITKCFNSFNSEVAERALYVWNNEHVVKMASQAVKEVFLVLVEGMEKNLKWHWSDKVRDLTENVKVMLEEMEPDVYSKCLQNLELQQSIARQEEIRRKEKWERIERYVRNKTITFK